MTKGTRESSCIGSAMQECATVWSVKWDYWCFVEKNEVVMTDICSMDDKADDDKSAAEVHSTFPKGEKLNCSFILLWSLYSNVVPAGSK